MGGQPISGVDAIARATDATLNWNSGEHAELPGGAGDPSTMPSGARQATGTDEEK